jgi:hypothetical protein
MRITRLLACALMLFGAFVLSCSDGFPPEFPAPDFTLKGPLTGEDVSLSTFKGTPVIIYWFASW